MDTREEIEKRLKNMTDFLKMEYLENTLKKTGDFSIKRFCHQNLAELYAGRKMFNEAARNMSSVAEIGVTFKDKREAYMKEVELWISAGQYDKADNSFTKALACGNTQEKSEMKFAIRDLYKRQASAYEKSMKNSAALKIWEKLQQNADEGEKLEIRNKLLSLYQRLGKIREYSALSGTMKKI